MTQPLFDQATISLLFECEATAGVKWVVQDAMLEEQLNEPYSLTLRLTSDALATQPAEMLGKPVQLTALRGTAVRMVQGIVTSVSEGTAAHGHPNALVVVQPALEALRHRINTKIFQEKTVPEILEEVLGAGLGAYDRTVENRLKRAYPKCDYRVQYDESDFAFCERLMEEEGIAYWFEFEGDAETMVLSDSASSYGTIESIHGSALQFTSYEADVRGHEYVGEFLLTSQLLPTKLATRHFDWNRPSTMHEGKSADGASSDAPDGATVAPEREIYHHDLVPLTFEPGGTTYAGDKDAQVVVRREAMKQNARVVTGRSTVFGMRAGATFALAGHPLLDGEYLATAVTHTFSGAECRNNFWCLPKAVAYRPRRTTPRPRVPSMQTATVVGPAGEEIHTDEHGRVKVQFHWDRLGAYDEHSSCWVRVMQPWGGPGWGFFFIPRIGMEVVVNFVNGDPDQPVVMGSLYNGENPPPLQLPAEKTKSTLRTNSSLGGGGFNELRFEDKKDREEIYTHAQKDYNEVVEHDHSTLVHNDQFNTVDKNQTEIVHVDQALTVDNNRTKLVKVNQTSTVLGNDVTTVQGTRTETVVGDETTTLLSNRQVSISSNDALSVGGSKSETVAAAYTQTVLGAHNVAVGAAKAEEVGLIYKIATGVDYSVDAGMSITLKTGASSITLKQDGTITIEGVKIEVNGQSLIKLTSAKIEQNC
jgi:type VI secretion system secreted protein VgrG